MRRTRSEIVETVKEVFKDEFESGEVPEHFVQKITYSPETLMALFETFEPIRISELLLPLLLWLWELM